MTSGRQSSVPLDTDSVYEWHGQGYGCLVVFDVTGRIVRNLVNRNLAAGVHEVTWDGTSDAGAAVSGGMYSYRLTAEDGPFNAPNKRVVIK